MLDRIKGAIRGIGKKSEAAVSVPESRSSASAAPGPAPADTEPVSLQHIWTPEANAVKLRVSRMLMPLGEKRSYPEPGAASDSPLAQALFELPGVTGVELDSVSVQVMLADDADWDDLMERIPHAIKTHLESGLNAVEGLAAEPTALEPVPGKKYSFGFRKIPEGSRPADEQMKIVKSLLDGEINPAVAAHGGFFNLIAVENNNVYVQLGGGCQGCGMVDVTLRQGVEQRMREVLPELNELIDVTDHRAGSNPFYQPSK
jgi:Fe-S cluster biogenesis protein NfuA